MRGNIVGVAFPNKFVKWVMVCVKTTHFFVVEIFILCKSTLVSPISVVEYAYLLDSVFILPRVVVHLVEVYVGFFMEWLN